MCDTLPEISFADFSIDPNAHPPFNIGDKIKFQCKYGYRGHLLFNSAQCVLENNEPRWTFDQHACVPHFCGPLGDLKNGKIIGKDFTYPNFSTFECDEGHILMWNGIRVQSGKFKTYCNDTGWTPKPVGLTCEPISCPDLKNPLHGTVDYKNTLYNSVATYACEKGYLLQGNDSRVCTSDKIWTGQEPTCDKITCPHPRMPGKIIPDKPVYDAGNVIVFECPFTGETGVAKCLPPGVWSSNFPACEPPKSDLNVFWIFCPILLLLVWIFVYGMRKENNVHWRQRNKK